MATEESYGRPFDAVPPGTGRHVLIVDDEEAVREIVGMMLERAGFEVSQAQDAPNALATLAAAASPVDLALIDVKLAGLDGRQLATQINVLSPKTTILYMSGGPLDEVASYGVFPDSWFIAKPFSSAELVARVSSRLPT